MNTFLVRWYRPFSMSAIGSHTGVWAAAPVIRRAEGGVVPDAAGDGGSKGAGVSDAAGEVGAYVVRAAGKPP